MVFWSRAIYLLPMHLSRLFNMLPLMLFVCSTTTENSDTRLRFVFIVFTMNAKPTNLMLLLGAVKKHATLWRVCGLWEYGWNCWRSLAYLFIPYVYPCEVQCSGKNERRYRMAKTILLTAVTFFCSSCWILFVKYIQSLPSCISRADIYVESSVNTLFGIYILGIEEFGISE